MMAIENQIAEIMLGSFGEGREIMERKILAKFPDATAEQIDQASKIAIEILEAAAEAYEAEAEPYLAESERRESNG